MDPSVRRKFDNLRYDIEKLTANIKQAENEVFRKEEDAFFARQDEIELAQLAHRQKEELLRSGAKFQAMLEERQGRKATKKLQKHMAKEAKAREARIRQQETAKNLAAEVREALAQHRKRFEQLIIHIEGKQLRQHEQLLVSQERKKKAQRALLDLEVKGQPADLVEDIIKDHQYKLNHQFTVDKTIVDQLRDTHELELKHRKERFDAEAKALESSASLRAQHLRRTNEELTRHKDEVTTIRLNILDAHERLKLMQLATQHEAEVQKLRISHRTQLTLAARSQKAQTAARLKKWRDAADPDADDADEDPMARASAAASSAGFGQHCGSVTGSQGGMYDDASQAGSVMSMVSLGRASQTSLAQTSSTAKLSAAAKRAHAEEYAQAQLQLSRLEEELKAALTRQAEEMKRLKRDQVDEVRRLENTTKAAADELGLAQDTEARTLRKSQESNINEIVSAQEREYVLDRSIRISERKMLTERRVLNSVLDTIADGIINIAPDGTITRFNAAAESMFGYTGKEIIGKNIRSLTPDSIAPQHDAYLNSYLTTGIKKVIGIGRRSFGRNKDGVEFPIRLSVSEVREEGTITLFTGIVRNLTDQVQREEQELAESTRKQEEMGELISQLDMERTRSNALIKELMPVSIAHQLMNGEPVVPRVYSDVTVLYTDLVGFTSISASVRPLDVVDMLNDLYSAFDEILEQYDVYKVETIGDSYMVASGVPRANGNKHLTEMAKL
ncbi:hypothetical protein BC828DRAFT_345522, partial [Blastocladiella britannica]